MTTLENINKCGEDLERLLLLKTAPIAVKLLEKEADIPEGAIRPKKDLGYHLAQCQAFAMTRRQRSTIAMLREDNWCFAPLIAYGLEDKPEDDSLKRIVAFPCLERGKYIGIISAPLSTANFEPDLVHIYSNTAQLRSLLLPLHFSDEPVVNSHFFPPDCAYTVVPVMSNGQYLVALPDPGNYSRALAGDDEIILSVPVDKLETLLSGIRQTRERTPGSAYSDVMMRTEFPRPDFYKMLFRRWGLDADD